MVKVKIVGGDERIDKRGAQAASDDIPIDNSTRGMETKKEMVNSKCCETSPSAPAKC